MQYSRDASDESKSRGVLDHPVKPDDDRSLWRSENDETIHHVIARSECHQNAVYPPSITKQSAV
jgi:hypothetical protein